MRRLAGVAAVLLLAATALPAQHPQIREGFWIAFGPGWASTHLSCTGCSGETRSDATFDLRLGGTLRPDLLLGGDLSYWNHSENGVSESFGIAAVAGYFYPIVTAGLFIKGGVGVSVAHFETGGQAAYGTGVGFLFGAGYDIRVARNFSVTPVLQFQYGPVGDIKFPNGSSYFAGLSQTLIGGGLDVTFH